LGQSRVPSSAPLGRCERTGGAEGVGSYMVDDALVPKSQKQLAFALTRRHLVMANGASGAVMRGSGSFSSLSGGHSPGASQGLDEATAGYAVLHMGSENENGTRPVREDSQECQGILEGHIPHTELVDVMQESLKHKAVNPGKPSTKVRQTAWETQRVAYADILCTWLNLLLIFVPIGLLTRLLEMNEAIVFGANFLAIIPLSSILGGATESLSFHVGQLAGGLLNATFGNAVEMIMCVQAIKVGLIEVVKGNLLGSILSNLLLVLGMAIFASGLKRKSQLFNAQGAAANMTCQLVASISVCLPTVFRTVATATEEDVLSISRVCSTFLMGVYGLFLYFMLKTHADLFQDEDEDDEGDTPRLTFTSGLLMLGVSVLLVVGCSEGLVDSIQAVSENYGLSKAFIGVILLPIVGNAAEHATAVTCAYKGMMDLALGVAVGSSTQIALFVVPCAVMCGWWYDKPMNLQFTVFDTTCQMLTVFLVSQVLQHGDTNWLHGAMLMTVYIFIAVQTLYIRDESMDVDLM